MKIKIGDGNKITKSKIGSFSNQEFKDEKGFVKRHPVLISFISSFLIGLVLLFPFWKTFVDFVFEYYIKLFK